MALGKFANQSSIYSISWGAAKAIDGDKRQEMFSSTCAKTGVGQKTASWYVDLGKIMSIHHVDIYYRKESDSEYGKQYKKTFTKTIPSNTNLKECLNTKSVFIILKRLGSLQLTNNVCLREIHCNI